MIILDLHFSIFLILFVILCVVFKIVNKRNKRNKSERKHNNIYNYMMIFYILALVKVVILPIYIGENLYFKENPSSIFQLVPFATIVDAIKYGNYIQIVGNIILLVPFPVLMQKVQNKVFSAKKIILIVIASSLSIECMQLIICLLTQIPNRIVDIDDLILNTMGGVIAIVFNKILIKILDKTIDPIYRITSMSRKK